MKQIEVISQETIIEIEVETDGRTIEIESTTSSAEIIIEVYEGGSNGVLSLIHI